MFSAYKRVVSSSQVPSLSEVDDAEEATLMYAEFLHEFLCKCNGDNGDSDFVCSWDDEERQNDFDVWLCKDHYRWVMIAEKLLEKNIYPKDVEENLDELVL